MNILTSLLLSVRFQHLRFFLFDLLESLLDFYSLYHMIKLFSLQLNSISLITFLELSFHFFNLLRIQKFDLLISYRTKLFVLSEFEFIQLIIFKVLLTQSFFLHFFEE